MIAPELLQGPKTLWSVRLGADMPGIRSLLVTLSPEDDSGRLGRTAADAGCSAHANFFGIQLPTSYASVSYTLRRKPVWI